MASRSLHYQLPDEWGFENGLSALSDKFELAVGAEQRLMRTYYDSFDFWILSYCIQNVNRIVSNY